ncbi:DUF1460 domain-containing protein [Dysgonomonas sp. 521]|uniref:N-acetylmuramoyl-L-alanine amidase-like domain-containing protein n=1 Tax=Dysgonomonas sp. 521 TaxID=2302932 RepID=UPI0013CFC524|nr:N-acetylmuramoyl-L-alanine amidase-like domain-containing protein [Dysgonomonas sp. 521]NDV96583.1 DUF1460 domain-containing protein [Dysgonomonas sp. 521]
MRSYKFFFFILLSLTPFYSIKGTDIVYTKADSLIFESYIKQFGNQKEYPVEQLLISTAKFLIGKPYVASTLELSENESLIINLRELDCTTFVENCIALSQTIKSENPTFSNYCRLLTAMRYRNGEIDGYTSRLHYTSDWIYENEKRGLLENISTEIGGKMFQHPVSFMSEHPQSYIHLKNNPENRKNIKEIEKNINDRNCYEIIPKSSILKNEKDIRSGDIVVFATSIAGLDYSHIGIAYWQDGVLHFIHASSKQKEVVVETKTLLKYCQDSKSCTGISILRINN